MDEIRRLITNEMNYMFDAKIFAISLSVNKTLARHLFDDCSNGIVELFNNEQLEHIQDKFYELSFPNIRNLVASFKHCSRDGYIDNILELKSNNRYDYVHLGMLFS
jgi:hypothetical protein